MIMTNCCVDPSNGSGLVKIWTSHTLDQVMKFSGPSDDAAFVLSSTNGGKFSVIGHQGGLLRLLNIESLKVDSSYKLPLLSEDEILTAAVFNPNGINLAVGTN